MYDRKLQCVYTGSLCIVLSVCFIVAFFYKGLLFFSCLRVLFTSVGHLYVSRIFKSVTSLMCLIKVLIIVIQVLSSIGGCGLRQPAHPLPDYPQISHPCCGIKQCLSINPNVVSALGNNPLNSCSVKNVCLALHF